MVFWTEAKNEQQQIFDLSVVNKIIYDKSVNVEVEADCGNAQIVNMKIEIGGTVYPGCNLSQLATMDSIAQCDTEFKGEITTEMSAAIKSELKEQFRQQAEANTEMFATASALNEVTTKVNNEVDNIVDFTLAEEYSSVSTVFTNQDGSQTIKIGGDCYAPIDQTQNIQAQVFAHAVVDILSSSIQNSQVFQEIAIEMDQESKATATGLASFIKALFDGLMGPFIASAVMAGLAVLALIFLMKGKGKNSNNGSSAGFQ